MIDIVLTASAGRLGDRLLGLPLGADEQDPAAGGRDLAGRLERPCSMGRVWVRSMTCTPLRTPNRYGAIFGFQRRV